jgi:hypothetical protein
MFRFREDRKQCTLERCQVPVRHRVYACQMFKSKKRRSNRRIISPTCAKPLLFHTIQTIDSRLQTCRIQFSSSATTTFPRGHLTCTTIFRGSRQVTMAGEVRKAISTRKGMRLTQIDRPRRRSSPAASERSLLSRRGHPSGITQKT